MWNALQDVVAAVTADSDEELDYTSEMDTSQRSADGLDTPEPSIMSSMLHGAATLLSDNAEQVEKSIPSFDIGLPTASSVQSRITKGSAAPVAVTAPQSPETPAMANTRHRSRTGVSAAPVRHGTIPPTTPTQALDSIDRTESPSAEQPSTPGVTGPTPSKPIVVHSPQIQPGSLAMHAQGPVTFASPPKLAADRASAESPAQRDTPEQTSASPGEASGSSAGALPSNTRASDTTPFSPPRQQPVAALPRRRADSAAFDGLRTAYASLKAELAASRSQVASLETELGRVRAELGTVTAQRDSAINQVRESETRLEEAEDDADTAEAEVERLGAELSRAKEEHETAAKLGRESLQEALASAASAREGESRARQLLWQLEAQEDVAGGEDQEEQEEAQTSSAKIKADRADDDDDDDDDAGATRATPRLSPVLAVASQYEAEELRGRLAERDAQLQEARSDAEEAGQALGKLHAVLRAEAAARAVVEGRLEAAMAALQERAQSAEAAAPASSGVESTRGSARDSSVVAELRRERAEALMTVAGAREELARVSKELHRNQRMFEELRGASVERRVVGRLLVEWIARPDKRRDVAHLMAGMLALSPREQQLVRSAAGDDTMAVPTSADGVAATDVVAATDSFFGFARALSEFVAEAAADQPPGTKAEPAGGPPDATPTSSNGPKAEKLVLRFDSV